MTRMKKRVIVFLYLFVLLSTLVTCGESVSNGIDRTKFQIGTWGFKKSVHDEEHVKDLKDCGIDFVVGFVSVTDTKVLDLFEKYGIGAIVRGPGPRWFGGDGSKAGKMREIHPKNKYVSSFEKYAKALEHPAVWMIDVSDEPSAKDMEYIGEISKWIKEKSPRTPPYVNLYPSYASVSQNTSEERINQLGTKTYKEYIQKYCKVVPVDFISYDFYVYTPEEKRKAKLLFQMYDNFNIVSKACRENNRSFWYILQANSHLNGNKPFEVTSLNRLRFQANTAMAFGAESICWACWTGWWTNNVLTLDGKKTAQYEKLKTVNKELRNIAPLYMRYKNIATHYVGFNPTNGFEKLDVTFNRALDTKNFKGVCTLESTPLIVGEMVPRKNGNSSSALFIVASGDPYDSSTAIRTLVFSSVENRKVDVLSSNGNIEVKRNGNMYSLSIPENSAVMIISRD
jgi:hypothetical protein